MECGFKVKITQEEIETLLDILPNAHHTSGKQRLAKSDVSRMLVLENFLDEQGRLDAHKVEKFLFPMCEADIFISHAHDDEELAGAFEGLLWHKFGLVAFIDSFVWDTCNQLKRDIEELTCRMDCAEYPELERLDMKLYSHEESIRVSERIDAILTGALIKMMHNVDCMFFLHTNCSAVKEQSTLSPWRNICIFWAASAA